MDLMDVTKIWPADPVVVTVQREMGPVCSLKRGHVGGEAGYAMSLSGDTLSVAHYTDGLIPVQA